MFPPSLKLSGRDSYKVGSENQNSPCSVMNDYREKYHVNDCPPKKAKYSSGDDSGNESDDTSIVVDKYPVPDYSINKLKLVSNATESQGEDSNNQNQTPIESNNNGEEPNEQVDTEAMQSIHEDQNQEIGRVMAFGCNHEGHLKEGLGFEIRSPTILDKMGEARFVKADGGVCSIDENGKLTVNGKEINIDKKFKFAVESYGSNFAVDEDDHLLSWGENDEVPLGHGHKEKVKEPTLINALAKFKIKQVCCKNGIAMCVTMDNWLYTWGKGDIFRYKNVYFKSPVRITKCGQVQQISMYYDHALLLGLDGNVYSVGSNKWGQLGLGHQNQAPDFNKIDQFDSVEVLKVQAGEYKSSVLTKSGEVYVFGKWNKTIYTEPHLIERLTGVVDISMCHDHILALTNNEKLFAWGYNRYGECGVASKANYIPTPTRVVGLEDKDVLQISAGVWYSLIKYKIKP